MANLDFQPPEPERPDEDEYVEFTIHGVGLPPSEEFPKGRKYVAFSVDGDALMASQARAAAKGNPAEIAEAVWGFLAKMFDEETYDHIFSRVQDGEFSVESLFEFIVEPLLEKFTDRPTQPSIASSGSQSSGGRRSTGRVQRPGRPPADYQRAASATSSTTGRRAASPSRKTGSGS